MSPLHPCLSPPQYPGGPPRSLEDLKDRYYSIARKLMVAREGTDATLLNQPLLRHPYNANAGA
jgi:DNA methyltransferase 1-associated protein 1